MVRGLKAISWLILLSGILNLHVSLRSVEASENMRSSKTWVININTASGEEIAAIPGLGIMKSQAIVEFREKHGLFRRADDLIRIRGIGERLLEKIMPYIVVEGETTLELPQTSTER